jgi:Flp pilus assembly pilin Flp
MSLTSYLRTLVHQEEGQDLLEYALLIALIAVAMNRLRSVVMRLTRDQDAQDLIEYALLGSLIAVATIAAVSQLGNIVNNVFWQTIAQTV